jgi:hypothetical protein
MSGSQPRFSISKKWFEHGLSNCKGARGWCNDGNCIIDEKIAYMHCEVDELGANGMVMNDKEDGKDQTIDMEVGKNGLRSL